MAKSHVISPPAAATVRLLLASQVKALQIRARINLERQVNAFFTFAFVIFDSVSAGILTTRDKESRVSEEPGLQPTKILQMYFLVGGVVDVLPERTGVTGPKTFKC